MADKIANPLTKVLTRRKLDPNVFGIEVHKKILSGLSTPEPKASKETLTRHEYCKKINDAYASPQNFRRHLVKAMNNEVMLKREIIPFISEVLYPDNKKAREYYDETLRSYFDGVRFKRNETKEAKNSSGKILKKLSSGGLKPTGKRTLVLQN